MRINLENTVFNFSQMVSELSSTIKVPTKAGTHLRSFTDFGVVLISWHRISENEQDSISKWLLDTPGPVFIAPEGWRMPQLLKALGAFKSSSAASSNGWNIDIEEGHTLHQIRINNIKGILSVFRVPNNLIV